MAAGSVPSSETARPAPAGSSGGDAVNVLIFDALQCSAFLVKSILLGQNHRVSITSDLGDACRRVETGLFDMILFDAAAPGDDLVRLVDRVHDLIPDAPIVALRGEEAAAPWRSHRIFAELVKPVRIGKVLDVARQAQAYLALAENRKWSRREVHFPVEVMGVAHPQITCRASNISMGGILLESSGSEYAVLHGFHDFFDQERSHPLMIAFRVNGEEVVELQSRVAFSEFTSDRLIRHVGMSFSNVPDTVREKIKAVMETAAA